MTLRQFGEAAIKILGVYYAASAVLGLATTLASFLVPHPEGFPSGAEIAALNAASLVAEALVAAFFLWRGGTLAAWLLRDEALPFSKLARRDWLFIGITLVGLVWALSGVPVVLEAVGKALWYAEESRQAMFQDVMRRSTQEIVNAALSIVIGIGVLLSARLLSRRLDSEP